MKSLVLLLITYVAFISPSFAQTDEELEKMIEEMGDAGSLVLDVLEDFGLEGETMEGSAKARLKDLLKGNALSFIKHRITGGDDISEGMDVILKKIYNWVNQRKRGQPCDMASRYQASDIAFNAQNLRVLRGSANIVIDLMASIAGAPELAKKLVENIGKEAYKKIRSELEKIIKEEWAKQKNEKLVYSTGDNWYSTGPCKMTMTTLWHKKKEKYAFIIKGLCDCNPVAIDPPYDPTTIPVKEFIVIGGGTIKPVLSTKDPKNPTIVFNATRSKKYYLSSKCVCDDFGSSLPPITPPSGSHVLKPSVGILNGTVYGVVIDSLSKPIENVRVRTSTLSGIVTETKTNEEGIFITEVPEEDSLRIKVDNIPVSVIPIIRSYEINFPTNPPDYVEPEYIVELSGNYPFVEYEQGENFSDIPVARSLSEDGSQAISTYYVPENLEPGEVKWYMTEPDGYEYEFSSSVYHITSAQLDQENLRSGQMAEFVYRFDFGEGPEREVLVQINTTGPINYEGEGTIQEMYVDPEGQAEFVGHIQAEHGTPAGIPFTIDLKIVGSSQ